MSHGFIIYTPQIIASSQISLRIFGQTQLKFKNDANTDKESTENKHRNASAAFSIQH